MEYSYLKLTYKSISNAGNANIRHDFISDLYI
uniref:Uncharacterized protein n=1 Tax=Anguilla anguilla TaxID=7936 RepID=A0A0E9V3I9_ANGAN